MPSLQALAIFDIVRSNWTDANVFSSTFDNYTNALMDRLPYLNLPVFTEEIGDTWIYGAYPHTRSAGTQTTLVHLCT